MRTLTVHENGDCPLIQPGDQRGLTLAQAQALQKIWPQGANKAIRIGRNTITFGPGCGIVGLGDVQVEILPKIFGADAQAENRGILIGMLARVENKLHLLKQEHCTVALQNHYLLNLFISHFLALLRRNLSHGLPRSYEQQPMRAPFVRGRVMPKLSLNFSLCLGYKVSNTITCWFSLSSVT